MTSLKYFKYLLLLIILIWNSPLNAQDIRTRKPYDTLFYESENYDFHNCFKSQSPIFDLPTNEVLEIEIKADFKTLFETKESEQVRINGVLSYTYNGEKVDLNIRVKARGKTRFRYCNFKPLDIKFDSTKHSTLFHGVNGKLHIINHCGTKDGEQWILKGTEKEHRDWLLAEYYIYSLLEPMKTLTRSVSLCKIRYLNEDNSVLTEEYAFIAEPYEDIATRCGLLRDKEKVLHLDESSYMNADLLNHFVANYDWLCKYRDSTGWTGQNVKFLKSNSNAAYVLPYDFDLNAISFPNYGKNRSESFDDHCYKFQQVVTKHFSDKTKLDAPFKLYSSIPVMREIIVASLLDETYKEKFLYLLDSYEFILYSHLIQYRKYKKLQYE